MIAFRPLVPIESFSFSMMVLPLPMGMSMWVPQETRFSRTSSSNTPLITDRSSAPSFDSELWQLLKVQENPGEFLSDIRIYLDQLLSRSLEESDIPWIEWYDSKLRSCSKSLDFNTHDKLMHFRRDLLAAASVDLSFADSMMLMQILDCNFKMGMKLPRVRT